MAIILRIILFLFLFYWARRLIGSLLLKRGANTSKRSQPKSSKNPYEILGISVGATDEEIKNAYRFLMQQYHPDKVQHLGEDLKKLAEEKTHDIQWAFEKLSSHH
ncbi:MAG: J domain-containing protein [Bdellovibrionales bacterium]